MNDNFKFNFKRALQTLSLKAILNTALSANYIFITIILNNLIARFIIIVVIIMLLNYVGRHYRSRSYPVLSARLPPHSHGTTLRAVKSRFTAEDFTLTPRVWDCDARISLWDSALSLTAPSLLPIFLRRYDWTRATGSDFRAERISEGNVLRSPAGNTIFIGFAAHRMRAWSLMS